MNCYSNTGANFPLAGHPVRNRYFYGKLLQERHFRTESDYFNQKRSLLNRLILGKGVLAGMHVSHLENGNVVIGPGVAIDALGREIVIPTLTAPIDPFELTNNLGESIGQRAEEGVIVSLCLAYHECNIEPIPVLVKTACKDDQGCEPSMIQERYRLIVRAGEAPSSLQECASPDLLSESQPNGNTLHEILTNRISQAPFESDVDPSIVLAQITLPFGDNLMEIDMAVRPLVYSNYLLQELFLCLGAHSEQMTLLMVSGDGQSAGFGEVVRDPLIVQVLRNGRPVSDTTVTFEVINGDGAVGDDLQSSEVATDVNGWAKLSTWKLGSATGGLGSTIIINNIEARLEDGANKIVFTAESLLSLPIIHS